MGGLCGFHNVAGGYLAASCVVLFHSHTSTARSFVLVSASRLVASWILPSPRMCASTPLSPPAFILKRYNNKKMKLYPSVEGSGMKCSSFRGEMCFLEESLLTVIVDCVRSRDISRAMGKYLLMCSVIILLPKTYQHSVLLVGPASLVWRWWTALSHLSCRHCIEVMR